MYRNTTCRLQAHRGVATDAPENTMSAFRLAVEQGYDVVEFDPKFTKDNRCVIIHDWTINRRGMIDDHKITEEMKVGEMTFEQLAKVDVGQWFDSKYAGEHIPTMEQTLEYLKGAGIEAKIDNVVQRFSTEQVNILFDLIANYGNELVGLTCSDLSLLKTFASRFQGHPLHYDGSVTEEALDELAEFAAGHKVVVWMRLDNKATSWNKNAPVSPEFSRMIKSRGFELGVWLLHTDEEMLRALAVGADIVETTGGIKPCRQSKAAEGRLL